MASEKRIRRVMPEEGVQLVRRQGVAPENLVGRDLHAPEPDMLRLTNITRIKRLRLLRLRASGSSQQTDPRALQDQP